MYMHIMVKMLPYSKHSQIVISCNLLYIHLKLTILWHLSYMRM